MTRLFVDWAFRVSLQDPEHHIAVYWHGRLSLPVIADWARTALTFRDPGARIELNCWSNDQEGEPKTYGSVDLADLASDTQQCRDGIVTLAVSDNHTGVRYYVWGDLADRRQPSGEPGEVGMKLDPGELIFSAARAMLAVLLGRTAGLEADQWEIEDLLNQIQSKVNLGLAQKVAVG
jgi:hypothetical protein